MCSTNCLDYLDLHLHAGSIPEIIAGESEWDEYQSDEEDIPGSSIKAKSAAHLFTVWLGSKSKPAGLFSLTEFLWKIASELTYGDYIAFIIDNKFYSFSNYETVVFRWGIHEIKPDGAIDTSQIGLQDLKENFKAGTMNDLIQYNITILM